MSLTRSIAEFVATWPAQDVPDACLKVAKLGMVDCVAVLMAGSSEPAVKIVSQTLKGSATDSAPEIPAGRRLDAADAALVNGVAAHALDYDDVGIDGHPSAVLVPAILAASYSRGTSGRDALIAYVVGYEVWAYLRSLEPGQLHDRGFHPTAIWGAVASAAACVRIYALSAEQAVHALGIAASMASGLVANFGSMTKPFHAGRAAQAGVLACRLASAGFTASPDSLENPSGYLQAHSPTGRCSFADPKGSLGTKWQILTQGLNVKRYPVCYGAHRVIDGVLALAENHNIQPESVARVDARIGATQAVMLKNHAPTTGLEAKFSLEFAVAIALTCGPVSLVHLTEAYVARPEVRELMAKVHITTTPEVLPDLPFAPEDEVSITLRSSQRYEHPPIAHAKGSWQMPLSNAELSQKFLACTEPVIGSGQAKELLDQLFEIERLASVKDLKVSSAALAA